MPDVEPVADEEYAPASGRHRTAPRGWRAARVTRLGPDVLHASARLVGEQVGTVLREAVVTAGGEASVQVVVTLDRPS